MSAPRYLVLTLASLALALLGVAAFNYLVDPYLVFDQARRAGFNQVKPAADVREWLMKAYEVPRQNPRTVVLGSSRSDIGLNPESPAWPRQWQPVYNLSMAGSNLGLNLSYLKHLLQAHGSQSALRTVVVGLDFESFLEQPGRSPSMGPPELEATSRLQAMAASSVLARQRVWQDQAEALLTLDAVIDSASAVLANRTSSVGVDLAANGRFSDGQLQQWTRNDGVGQLFKQKNLDTLKGFKPPRRSLDPGDGSLMHGQADIAELFKLAGQRQLQLILLIQPSHVSRLEMLDAMGYWAELERWKQLLAKLSDAARSSGVDVTLWDFSGYEPENLEAMPPAAQARTPLRWYWDPVHYRPAMGDRLVETMAAGSAGNGGSLVAPLTSATLEARLQRVRADRAAYRAHHVAEAAGLKALVCPGPSCAGVSVP